MANLYLFLILFGLADKSLSNFKTTELVSQMIVQQSKLCSYIALCHTPKSSVKAEHLSNGYFTPCCMECSCLASCIENDTCCPDYLSTHNTSKAELSSEKTTDMVATKEVQEKEECVKIEHGTIQSQTGVMMIATCPSSYHDVEVKRKCEMKLDCDQPFDLFDHIPVTDIHQDQTYKNRHCAQCNMLDQSPSFWNIYLRCEFSFFHINLFPVKDVLTFINYLILERVVGCNIVFEQASIAIGVNGTSKNCVYNTMIDTCNNETSNELLQKLCSKYTWPIEAYVFPEKRLYKNYACMLCNGIEFQERCLANLNVKTVNIQFTFDFNKAEKLTTSSYESRTDQQIINRYFPNKKGEVHCKKGYVYDVIKRKCRLVLCPQYFFVADGECVPLFRNLNGVNYQMCLQADVKHITKEHAEQLKDAALTKGFFDILHGHLGDGLSEFSVWKNLKSHVKDRYIVQISISRTTSEGPYISILNFANNIIKRKLTLNENSSVVLNFNSAQGLKFNGKFFQLAETRNDKFLLIDSYKKNGNEVKDDLRTPMYISPSLLCYRISLSEKEVAPERTGQIYTSVPVLNKPIHQMNLQKVNKEKEESIIIVCLDQGLRHVASTVNLFNKDSSNNYTFISLEKTKKQNADIEWKTSGDNENMDLNKSIVASISTFSVILFIIISRRIMKRRVAIQMDAYFFEYVNGKDGQIVENISGSLNGDATGKEGTPAKEVP